MKLFKNFDWSTKSILKVIGLVLAGIIALSIAAGLINFTYRAVTNGTMKAIEYGKGGGMAYDMVMEEAMYDYDDGAYSQRAYSSPSAVASYYNPTPSYSTGSDAEEYEVRYYNANIKTRKLDKTCATIHDLKIRTDVIFEDSNQNEDYCYYSFKVEKEKADEIVKIIEDLDPETLNENTQSIKRGVEAIEDELTILGKKLASIEETLENAQSAYDEISQLATSQKDAETLAKVIDSKLNLIERLTSQKLQVKSQIDRYNEAKNDQMDRLNYTFFSVNVYKDLIFDWKQIKDNWNYEAKQLVRNINDAIQGVTLSLVNYLFRFVQYALYILISIFLIKFVWVIAKKIWKMNCCKLKKK